MDVVTAGFEASAAADIDEVDHERAADDLRFQSIEQRDRGERGAAGREQVVDHQHALAGGHRIDMELDTVGAVLERVVVPDGLARKLAGLADRNEADVQRVRE